MEFYIERKIVKRGKQKIKIKPEEIKQIAEFYKSNNSDDSKDYYNNLLLELIARDYSKRYIEYLINKHEEFINELVDFCFHNQYLIDTDGIAIIYELDIDNKKQLDQYYNEMLNNQPLDEFIEDLVKDFDEITTSDLQGVVQARCMRTKEDENTILNEIYNKVDKRI